MIPVNRLRARAGAGKMAGRMLLTFEPSAVSSRRHEESTPPPERNPGI